MSRENVLTRLTDIVTNIRRRLAGSSALERARPGTDSPLNPTQELFCIWNAERLRISLEESRQRFFASYHALPHGHGGKEFRRFCDLSYQMYRPFCDDTREEIDEAYRLHAPMHFLRMLSYDIPMWDDADPVLEALKSLPHITVIDFGCGLAHRSRALAEKLLAGGQAVNLVLVDIATVRKPFLLWVGRRTGIPVTFVDCSAADPLPSLPPAHVCIATDVFEHLHDPMRALNALHGALLPGGLLVTDVDDHRAEYMHVSPQLKAIRDRLASLHYEELKARRLYRKRID